jgi:hypothetical protein
MREISLALVWFEAVEQLANAFPGRLKGSFRGFAHEMFELGEDLLGLANPYRLSWFQKERPARIVS